jgi:superfamily II DNA helicase RecQ
MQFNTFFIPLADDSLAQEELNSFLRSKRVLAVEKAFTGQGWSFCVEWLEGGKPGLGGKPKVDYREVLSPEEFVLFSKLREKRRELAQRDGVQVYTIMTNEQLAEIVHQQVKDIAGLRKIDGVGEARIEKYGGDFLALIGTTG